MTRFVHFVGVIIVGLIVAAGPVLATGDPPPLTPPPTATGAQKIPPPPPLPPHPGPAQPKAEAPVLERVAPGLFRLGSITIHKPSSSVSFPAVVNMNKGLLEYLLVRTGGKTHESLLRTDVDPAELQVALLLLGLEGTDRPLAEQGDPASPRGNPVEITLSYLRDGRMLRLGCEDWLAKKSGDAMEKVPPLSWVFTGSIIRDGRFLARAEGSVIALYHDPVALVDNASAGGESDKIWFVQEGAVPPVGTPVTVVISARR